MKKKIEIKEVLGLAAWSLLIPLLPFIFIGWILKNMFEPIE